MLFWQLPKLSSGYIIVGSLLTCICGENLSLLVEGKLCQSKYRLMESYVFSFDLLSVSTGYIIVPGFEGNTSTLSQKYCGPKLKDSL